MHRCGWQDVSPRCRLRAAMPRWSRLQSISARLHGISAKPPPSLDSIPKRSCWKWVIVGRKSRSSRNAVRSPDLFQAWGSSRPGLHARPPQSTVDVRRAAARQHAAAAKMAGGPAVDAEIGQPAPLAAAAPSLAKTRWRREALKIPFKEDPVRNGRSFLAHSPQAPNPPRGTTVQNKRADRMFRIAAEMAADLNRSAAAA